MAVLADQVQMTVSGTPGTGTITLGTAVTGYQSFASAGVANGSTVSYGIADAGNTWELGRGVYTSSGTTLTRVPLFSSNSNAAISATSLAIVSIVALAEDFNVAKMTGAFTANGQLGTVPANAMLLGATLRETAGHSVNVSLGTASGGAQILAATTVGASAIVPVPAISMLLQAWTAAQNVFVASTAWGSANVTVNLWYLQ